MSTGESLLEREERFQLLVEQISEYAIFLLDVNGHVATWNAGARRIKQYTADEIVGRHFSVFYPPEDTWKCAQELEVASREGRVEDEGFRVRKDGTRFWANVVLTALHSQDGRLVAFAKVTRDLTERKRAEEVLRQSEERFRLLVENVKDYAIFLLDPNGTVASWNVGAERIKGYQADEIVGQHFSRFYPEEDIVAGKCELELEIAGREGRFEDEGWRLRKDGTQFWANVVLTALRGTHGDLVGFAKITRDLTDRKRAEDERLRSSLATTVRSIGEAVIATDANGVITLMNGIAETLTGWSEEEARGLLLDKVAPLTADPTNANTSASATLQARDGRDIAIEVSSAPIQSAGGAAEGVVFVLRDVTQRKAAEIRRAFLADATAALTESLDDEAMLVKVVGLSVPRFADWSGVYLLEQETSVRRLTVAHADPSKIEVALAVEPSRFDKNDATSAVARVLRSGQPELHAKVHDGMLVASGMEGERLRALRELNLRSFMIVPLTSGGRVLGAMSFVCAESERHYDGDDLAFAEALAQRCANAIDNARLFASEQLARRNADIANRAKDEFLAVVSHELRTPLNAIMGWAKMLSAPDFEERRRQSALETIVRNSVAMAQLIEDLLDMSRVISGKMFLEVQDVDFAAVVASSVESMEPTALAKGVTLSAEIGAVPRMQGDTTRLQQVAWNLLNNAVKFTPKGGSVRVVLRTVDGSIALEVIDTGKGIAPDFLPNVFEPFQQENGASSRARGGLGLGLAIARQLVELHGGRIEVDSAGLGHGAKFTVTLPSVEVSARRDSPVWQSRQFTPEVAFEKPLQLDGLRVLVVDDDDDARELVATILRNCGSEVTTADSVEDALSKFAAARPDVLLSDIGMPHQDGYDLIRQIRALPAEQGGNVPAAALTAFARPTDRRRMLDAGFSIHLPKPVEPAELTATVVTLSRFSPNENGDR